jgi:hypothetical protein
MFTQADLDEARARFEAARNFDDDHLFFAQKTTPNTSRRSTVTSIGTSNKPAVSNKKPAVTNKKPGFFPAHKKWAAQAAKGTEPKPASKEVRTAGSSGIHPTLGSHLLKTSDTYSRITDMLRKLTSLGGDTPRARFLAMEARFGEVGGGLTNMVGQSELSVGRLSLADWQERTNLSLRIRLRIREHRVRRECVVIHTRRTEVSVLMRRIDGDLRTRFC